MSWLAGLRGRDAGDDADRWLLVITLLLLGAGLAMVLSASSVISLQRHGSPYYFFVRQVLFAGVGLAALAVLRRVDYHRSEEHTSELQSQSNLVCRLLLEKKKNQ